MRRVVATLGVLASTVALAAVGWAPSGDDAFEAAIAPAALSTTTLRQPPAFPTPTTLPEFRNIVAMAIGPSIDVYEEPGALPVPWRTLPNPRKSGAEQVLLVIDHEPGWLEVLVPVRPNGSTGWIRAEDVTIVGHDYRIVVELGAHRLTVFEGDEVFHQEPVGVGVGTTPTPGGRFFTVELFRSQKAAYGPYAYGLSGYSEVFYDFGGGDGQFGIHGTNNPSGLGRDVSNGCIRMSNAGITRLAETLPIGVPVDVVA